MTIETRNKTQTTIRSSRVPLAAIAVIAAGVAAAPAAAAPPAAKHIIYPTGVGASGDVYAKKALRGASQARLVGYPRSTVSLKQLRRSGRGKLVVVSRGGRPVAVRDGSVRDRASEVRTRGIVLTTTRAKRRAHDRPDTWIASGPRHRKTTTSRNARLRFGTDVGTRFRCSLDGGPFKRCRTPIRYKNLDAGRHVFRVKAIGPGGKDRSPARRTWKVAAGVNAPGTKPGSAPDVSRALGGPRPYDANSPWNTPIASNTPVLPQSSTWVNSIADNNQPLTSDPDQYALPVYELNGSETLRPVRCATYREWPNGDRNPSVSFGSNYTKQVPIPAGAVQSDGSDGQIIFWNPQTGDYWEFWQFKASGANSFTCSNGRHGSTAAGNLGRFADGTGGRGGGTSYLAGTVRGWELAQGQIDHALAFAYDSPGSGVVYPASKSDGAGGANDAPEGTRFQLDPSVTEADFDAWGLAPEAKTIARAMQKYGMYTIDNSGSSKIYLEDRLTAKWAAGVTRDLTAKIPWSKFRAVAAPAAP